MQSSNFFTRIKDDFIKYRTLVFIVFTFFMAATLSFLTTGHPDQSNAVAVTGFNPGNIISDAVMANYNSMTVTEIQEFLTSKNSCKNTNYALYQEQSSLYKTVTWHWSGDANSGHFVCLSEERFDDGVTIGSGQTAAEIIYDAAQEYRINPQVLLVLLEKEQGLITDTYPHSGQYRSATGYGCPDTAACDSKYYGFKNQIFRAAELFRYTLDNGYYLYPENKSGVFVAYNPSSACGGTNVVIENRATAALYRYTPYQPNTAALAAGYGQGDTCSAYGNRNFYLYFTDWFGSTQAAVDGEQIVIPDGEYSFVAQKSTDRTFGVKNTNVELLQLNDTDKNQRWNITRDSSTGYYTFTNVATGKVLDLYNNKTAAGTNIQIYASDNSCGQHWKIYRTSDNYLTIESACASGMVVTSAVTSTGANIQLDIFNKNSAPQKWSLRTGKTIKEGVYAIGSSRNSNYGLDIEEARTNSGANVHFWTFLSNYNQLWKLTYDFQTDDFIITNPYSGKNIDVTSAKYASGTNIQIWENNSTCAQRWKIAQTNDGYFYFMSACNYDYAIDLQNDPADGNNIQLWQTNNTPNQKWVLSRVEQGIIEDGIYTIGSAKTIKQTALDIVEARTNSGANVYLWNLHGNYNQLWRLTYDKKSGNYTITNPYSNKSLDVSGGEMRNRQNVQIWENNSTCAQRWKIAQTNDGYYNILSACDQSYALNLNDSILEPGSNLIIWKSDDSNSQKWQFSPIS